MQYIGGLKQKLFNKHCNILWPPQLINVLFKLINTQLDYYPTPPSQKRTNLPISFGHVFDAFLCQTMKQYLPYSKKTFLSLLLKLHRKHMNNQHMPQTCMTLYAAGLSAVKTIQRWETRGGCVCGLTSQLFIFFSISKSAKLSNSLPMEAHILYYIPGYLHEQSASMDLL